MSRENLELVRSIFVAWERGDFSAAAWADPEIEWVIADGPNPGRWSGLAEMAAGFREFVAAWEGYRVEADEYRELDHKRILVLVHLSGRGKTSGLELEQVRAKAANLFHLCDGRVTKHAIYWDRERAFADLGLAPEGDSAAPWLADGLTDQQR